MNLALLLSCIGGSSPSSESNPTVKTADGYTIQTNDEVVVLKDDGSSVPRVSLSTVDDSLSCGSNERSIHETGQESRCLNTRYMFMNKDDVMSRLESALCDGAIEIKSGDEVVVLVKDSPAAPLVTLLTTDNTNTCSVTEWSVHDTLGNSRCLDIHYMTKNMSGVMNCLESTDRIFYPGKLW